MWIVKWKKRRKIVAAIDDLNAAVTALNASVATCINVLQELSAKITTGVDPTAVEAAVSQLTTATTSLNTAVTTAQAVLNPPTA